MSKLTGRIFLVGSILKEGTVREVEDIELSVQPQVSYNIDECVQLIILDYFSQVFFADNTFFVTKSSHEKGPSCPLLFI